MSKRKLIIWLTYIALIIPALPRVLFPMFEPYTFGKTVFFEIIVEIMALICLLRYLEARPLNKVPDCHSEYAGWRAKNPSFAILLFFTSLTISTILSINHARSFWGSSARMDGLFTLLHFGLFFWILTATLEKEDWLKLIRFFAFVGFGTALYGLAQWINLPLVGSSGGEISSTFGNSAFYATYLLFAIFLSFYASIKEQNKNLKILLALMAVFEILTLLLTQNRGAILGLAIAALIFIILKCLESRSLNIGVATIAGVFLLLAIFSPQFKRIRAWPTDSITAQSRLYIWKEGLKIAAEHPFLGRGANNFEIVAPQTNEAFDKPHNFFVETLISYGTLGLIAYIFLLYAIIKKILARGDSARYLILALLAGYLTALFFFFDTFSSYLMFFFLLAHLNKESSADHKSQHCHPEAKLKFGMTNGKSRILLASFSIIILFFAFHFKPIYSAYYAREFLMQARAGIIDENLKNKALKYKSFNSDFISRAVLPRPN